MADARFLARRARVTGLSVAALLLAAPLGAQTSTGSDSIRAGRFDFGKMWTFESPPSRYFTETYGFDANAAWFERARGAALRIPGCSAALVSPRGLVVTNHHCIRGAIAELSRPGENLLNDGFYARSLQDERPIPNYVVEQLVAVTDVSAEILAAVDAAPTDAAARRTARADAIRRTQERITRETADPSLSVQVVPLYSGGRYSAYTFRRFTDVRLVAAAELQMGFFGGDPDNFTYPRYALDFGFLRIYGADGKPIENTQYFDWSERGPQEGDPVFVIGSPGTTNRLNTMAQLEFRRDVLLPAQTRTFGSRIDALWDFYREDPRTGDEMDLRNAAFSLSNTWKQLVGQADALVDPTILALKRDAERQFLDSVAAKPALRATYGGVIDAIAALQPRNRALDTYFTAFTLFGHPTYESALIRRTIEANLVATAVEQGMPADSVTARVRRLNAISDLPPGLERRLLVARMRDFEALPASDPIRTTALAGASAEAAADRLLATSALATAAKTSAAAASGISRTDPGVALATVMWPRYVEGTTALRAIQPEEADLQAQLGRARFEIYGAAIPPDGSSSPRITDGVVIPYEYNGTIAPVHTTFFGMYDRYYANGGAMDWSLPSRWVPPPKDLDLGTALNFISTADTYGGNSGSPAVTKDMALVGLNFDRNMEGLSRNFIYLPERGRNIMVDVRAIREALDDVYDADRIVKEVLTHRMVDTEQEADAAR